MERRTVVIISATTVLFVGSILFWALASNQTTVSANLIEMTDPTSIRDQVQLSHLSIATSENYVGHRLRVISGVVKNTSDKPLRVIDVKMVFTDYDGKPLQQTVQRAFESMQRPLAPGAQHHFEVNFENLPKNWNYRVPNVQVVKIAY